jgi:uncharacterized damage-inducible protein DinB
MSERKNIDLLIYELEDIRKVLLKGVEHLTKEQLFTPPVPGEFPIGAFLMHMAEVDLGWLATLSEGSVDISDDVKKRSYYNSWYDAWGDDQGEPPTEALEIQTYLDTIAETRKMLIDYINTMTDEDLEKVITRKHGENESSFTKKWIIYHLIEHEAHHRGQMFMLIRMAGWNKDKDD